MAQGPELSSQREDASLVTAPPLPGKKDKAQRVTLPGLVRPVSEIGGSVPREEPDRVVSEQRAVPDGRRS